MPDATGKGEVPQIINSIRANKCILIAVVVIHSCPENLHSKQSLVSSHQVLKLARNTISISASQFAIFSSIANHICSEQEHFRDSSSSIVDDR